MDDLREPGALDILEATAVDAEAAGPPTEAPQQDVRWQPWYIEQVR